SLNRLIDGAADASPSPDTKVALQKVASQVSSKRKVTIDNDLAALTGPLVFVPVYLHLHAGQEVPETLWKEASQVDDELHDALMDYARMAKGEVENWDVVMALENDNGLDLARTIMAWVQAPAQAEQASSEALTNGMSLLAEAGLTRSDDRLIWWKLKAFHKEGKKSEALEVLTTLSLDANSDVAELLPLVVELGDPEADAWLEGHIDVLEPVACMHMIKHESLPLSLRLLAVERLCDVRDESWDAVSTIALPLLARSLDLERLADVFSTNSELPVSEPHLALMVAHLAPASLRSSLGSGLNACRQQAIQAIHGTDLPDVFTPLAEHLLLLLEGIYKETPALAEVLNLPALRAFSPSSRALVDGGVVKTTHLRNLEKELDELDIDIIEKRLFEVILLTLRMNGFIQDHQIGRARDETVVAINDMVNHPAMPYRLMDSFSFLVLEHDLGLPNLVEWYQQHAPLSSWAPLARAALFAADGDELNSAREYMRAAEAFGQFSIQHDDESGEDDDSALAYRWPFIGNH
ncbi:MAG: hypothetical protein L7S02_00900, partial [Flavobacteriales bacterium]|nr:hypothetical protein [Flavobacteriales bacterium]